MEKRFPHFLIPEGILVHKASFGDQLPKPGAKPQGWEPGQDILFGSMSFSNLQTNVAKLGTKKADTSVQNEKTLDEKLEMLKNNGAVNDAEVESDKIKSLHNTEQLMNLNDNQISNMLPDVVQDHGRGLDRKVENFPEQKNLENINQDSGNFEDILGSLNQMKIERKGSGTMSPKSVSSVGSKPSSVSASPAHSSRDVSCSPKPDSLSSSLAELQDPTKFTIGTSEGKKKKITKADFTEGKKGPKEVDPSDPLGSLDPFWTLK